MRIMVEREKASLEILLQRFAIKRSFNGKGIRAVPNRIILFQNPGITFLLFLRTAFKEYSATQVGDFAASLPQSPCPLICSLTSSRVGIVFQLFFGGVKLLLLLFSFIVRIVRIFMRMFI